VSRARRALLGGLLAATALGPAAADAAPACEPPRGFTPRGRLESGDLVVLYRTLPAAVEVGRHFSVEAVVCAPAPARLLRVDADMPEHRHGMNYRARVSTGRDGRYVAEGLLFHMPGRWRLLLDVERGAATERLAADIVLE
jgi:hypothetical protein